ncbi:DUF952 domain-containing protein [Rothia terrae]|jgi:uncharacterized protein (DUF952 family)|uniref:DUF952 domain-containing protein n=1 Tax=Rothia terrae TaxID=396015 RepID=A0A7H2BFF0_9MICC|nr:DUF952 domain-containing protein [Rothia terrae]MDT0190665.1 DUF952 domain-containing protein [Rothia terrae]NKZ34518.1 DUF952 domain-containing protein [Rothia terrae]QNV38396.1 DUF952 domain-containing protein [Rothia terrae]
MLFHLALPEDFAVAQDTGVYTVSTRGRTIDEVGFIHCSASVEQVREVWQAFYSDREDILLLAINEDAVEAEGLTIKFENSDPNDAESEIFPHIYGGPLPLSTLKIQSSGLPLN